MTALGDDIISLLGAAKKKALIVAPFVRSEALSRLLNCIQDGTDTTVVTRWRPADLFSGASDLGVFDLTESRSIPLYLRQDLHAKYFAADAKCLIGSANVTLTALGWRTPANLELLTAATRSDSHIVEFERELLSGAVRATVEQRDRLAQLLELSQRAPIVMAEIADLEKSAGLLPPSWVPRVRNPEELFSVYCGNADVSRSALPTMQSELEQIVTVRGLDEEGFRAWVAATISQTPLIDRVVQHIEREGDVTEHWLGSLLGEVGVDPEEFGPRDVLEILERWLTYFLSGKYETARDSIKLIKAKNL